METNKNIEYWDLIAKYYSDECTQQEIDELLNWKNINTNNQILFTKVKEDLEIINLNKSMNKINVDSAWKKLSDRIQENEQITPIVEEEKNRFMAFSVVLKYAAAIIILVSVGFFSIKIYQRISNNNMMIELASVDNQTKEVVLPDGSTVNLYANSKIIYAKTFSENERRVELEGEAFFDVTKNPDRPFIIDTKGAEVKVLGTSFNVNATIPGDKVEVFVQTGLVQLASKKDKEQKVLINPGNVGILTKKDIVNKKNDNKNIVAWKTKELIFKEDNIETIIRTLNKVYNSNITCENKEILNLRYTSTTKFKNEEVDSILNVICRTFDLKIENKDDKIFLIKHDS